MPWARKTLPLLAVCHPDCNLFFPQKTGFPFAQVPYKTGFTVCRYFPNVRKRIGVCVCVCVCGVVWCVCVFGVVCVCVCVWCGVVCVCVWCVCVCVVCVVCVCVECVFPFVSRYIDMNLKQCWNDTNRGSGTS
jgi:hypothetical protein